MHLAGYLLPSKAVLHLTGRCHDLCFGLCLNTEELRNSPRMIEAMKAARASRRERLGASICHDPSSAFYPVCVAECNGALDDKGQTALMRAAILDDLYALHLLVHIEGQVRCQNLCGLTASMFSAIYDHSRALNITIPFECNMTDADGWAALTHTS